MYSCTCEEQKIGPLDGTNFVKNLSIDLPEPQDMSFRGTSIPSHGEGSVVEEVAVLPCRSKLCDDESDSVLGIITSASPASLARADDDSLSIAAKLDAALTEDNAPPKPPPSSRIGSSTDRPNP